VRLPQQPIEVAIALSLVVAGVLNLAPRLRRLRLPLAFGFGLVHGFGFSFALRESLQFAGSHLATSLVSFNIGVELGQIFVLAIAVPTLAYVFKHIVAERMGTIILSAFVAHTAWHWMLDRWNVLRQYTFELPDFNASFAAGVMRAMMLLVFIGGVAWVLALVYRRLGAKPLVGEAPEASS
jgi:hypothetical protein